MPEYTPTEDVYESLPEGSGEAKRTPKIDNHTFAFMMGVALLFDVLSAIPWIGLIFSFFAVCIFALWFYKKGVGLMSPKKTVTWATGLLSEFGFGTFGLGVWPGISVGVLLTILISRFEDYTGLPIQGALSGNIKDVKTTASALKERFPRTSGDILNRMSDVRPPQEPTSRTRIPPQPQASMDDVRPKKSP